MEKKLKRPSKKNYNRIPTKWNKWLDAIQKDTMHQLHLRNVYSEVMSIYRNNKDLQKKTVFINYIRETYSHTIAMGIRRVIDPHKRSLSLIKLMWEICDNCDLLTRERYVRLYKSEDKKYFANRDYDKIVGKEALSLSKRIVRHDISILKYDNKIKLIKNYANKVVGHRNIYSIKKVPTYKDASEAFDKVEFIVKRYSMLLFAQGWDYMTPTIQENWKAVFEVPWIRR